MARPVRVSLTVNGVPRSQEVEPRLLLVHLIRDHLGLTGTHVGCDTSNCGACTVHLNGDAVKSCTVLAVQADGAEVTTIEGIGSPDKLSEVQQAFMDHDASQCGFCTPGFVTAATAFVREHPNATVEQVRAGMGGNLCRCGTYAGMLLAVSDAAKKGAA